MSMSDCEKCWDTPCTCGYEYRNWSDAKKKELVKAIMVDSLKFKKGKKKEKSDDPIFRFK